MDGGVLGFMEGTIPLGIVVDPASRLVRWENG